MGTSVEWRLPTMKEIGITVLIVLPIALILAAPMQRARLKQYPGAIEVKKQLKKSPEDIREAVELILKTPEMIPLVSDEIEKALGNKDPEIRILISEMLLTAVPDEQAYMDKSIYVTDFVEILADLYQNDPDQDVREAAISCLVAWDI